MLNSSWVFATSSGQRNAPHIWMNPKMPTAARAVPDSGAITRARIHHSVAPSTRAASRSSLGMADATCWRTRKMPKLMIRKGRAMPWYVLIQPIGISWMYSGIM